MSRRPTSSEEADRRRELVRAFLAGYGQAVEDFRIYAASGARRPSNVKSNSESDGRSCGSTSGTAPPKES